MKRLALAVALLTLVSASVAIASAVARTTKLPTFNCFAPDEPCQVATAIHANYSAPPAEANALSTFTITLSGELRAPGDRGICKPHRKVEAPVEWLEGSRTPRSGPTKVVYTNGEGKFELTMTVTAPAGSTGYIIPIEAIGGAVRKFKGVRTVCEQSERFSGTHWNVEPENGWAWGGMEAPPVVL
jgi:hypothetical protein